MRRSQIVLLMFLVWAQVMPSFAASRPELAKPEACRNSASIVKGNVNKKEQRLYYLPAHQSYRQVKINKIGERWFCSAADAKAAGWRPASPSGRKPRSRPIVDASDFRVPEDIEKTGCDIKGNVAKDARRYHLRGSPYYAETNVNKTHGDRWFCSESEARVAGFEKAGTYIGGKSVLNLADCVVPEDPKRPPGCTIKDNVSRSGKIFHVLGSTYYAETTITHARGERWFCSEREALAQNWRPPKNTREPIVCPLIPEDPEGIPNSKPMPSIDGSRSASVE